MKYKDYIGETEVDEEAGIIFGRVLGIRDVITFRGETVREARRSFEQSVDFYLKACIERGVAPERPFSGKFVVRVEPDLHRALARAAEETKQSMNSVIEQALRRHIGERSAPRPTRPEEGVLSQARGSGRGGGGGRMRATRRPGLGVTNDLHANPGGTGLPTESALVGPGLENQ